MFGKPLDQFQLDHDSLSRGTAAPDATACDALSTDAGVEAELEQLEQLLRTPLGDEEAAYLAEPECEQVMRLVAATFNSASNGQLGNPQPSHPPAVDDLPPLRRLGEYELQRKLGAGGMGTVYLARHARLRREVALKLLPTDRLKDSAAVARFDREMQAVGQLNHPNIVVAHDAGEVEGTHYLAMELVEGRDVGELARELGPLGVADACEIVRQAALGLQHAHERGMVHRDIKPSNLMLTRGGQVKILDMGLALLSEKHLTAGELTGSGQLMGTLDYMAPEQGSSSHRVDIRADIYSLGATLYKLLCGQAPFGGAAYDTPVRKLMALATENPQPVEQRRPDVPAELAALVDRMLARNPEHRPASPAEVAAALAPFAASSDLIQLLVGTAGATPSPENTVTDPYLSASATDTTSSRDSGRMDIPVRPTNEKDIPIPPLTPATKTSPTKPAPSARWHRRTPILIATAAGLLALIALAIVMTLQTPQGTVTVEIAEQYRDQVTVVVKGGGKEIELSGRDGWQAKLAEGRYTVDLKGSSDQFELSDQTLTIRRGKDQVVRVNHAPRVVVSTPPPAAVVPDTPPSVTAPSPPAPAGTVTPPRVVSYDTVLPENDDSNEPLSQSALVRRPAAIPGATGWTIQTRAHRGAVLSVTFSPDESLFATVGLDHTVRIWEASSGRLVRMIIGDILKCQWSPTANVLAAVTAAGEIELWDIDHARRLWTLHSDSTRLFKARSTAWSPDGKQVAVSYENDGTVRFWSAESGEPTGAIPTGGERVDAVVYLADNAHLVTAGRTSPSDASMTLWNLESKKDLESVSLQRLPDGMFRYELTASRTGEFISAWVSHVNSEQHNQVSVARQLYRYEAGKLRHVVDLPSGPGDLLPDGEQVVVGTSVLAVEGGELTGKMNVTSEPTGVTSSQSGLIAVGCIDGSILGVDAKTLASRWSVIGNGSAAWHFSGRRAFWSRDGTQLVRMNQYALTSFSLVDANAWSLWIGGGNKTPCAFSPDNKLVAVSMGNIELRNARTGQLVRKFLPGQSSDHRFEFSPDGAKMAFFAKDVGLRLLDLATGEVAVNLQYDGRFCYETVFSPDGGKLVTCSQDVGTQIWSTHSGELLHDLGRREMLGFSPCGRWLVLVRQQILEIVEAASGATFDRIRIESTNGGPRSAYWMDGENSLVFATDDGRVTKWDMEARTCHELSTAPVGWPGLSPDGSLLAGDTDKYGGVDVTGICDVKTGQILRTLVRLTKTRFLRLTPDGHWDGSPGVERDIVYIVRTADGQQMLTPDEFAQKYNWKNDPTRVPLRPKQPESEPDGDQP
jgi:serine/threonine protein kinase/WD40 repeat protein